MSIQGATDYQHPNPNYQLNGLHQAMDYNTSGQPIIRVSTASSGYGNTDILTLTVTTTSNSPKCLFNLGWAELSN